MEQRRTFWLFPRAHLRPEHHKAVSARRFEADRAEQAGVDVSCRVAGPPVGVGPVLEALPVGPREAGRRRCVERGREGRGPRCAVWSC